MTQPSFDFPDTPRARRSDPLSSHVAADKVKPYLNGQRAAVHAALVAHPGRTSSDLAHVAKLDRYMVARRLPELHKHRYAKRVDRDGKQTLWFAAGEE